MSKTKQDIRPSKRSVVKLSSRGEGGDGKRIRIWPRVTQRWQICTRQEEGGVLMESAGDGGRWRIRRWSGGAGTLTFRRVTSHWTTAPPMHFRRLLESCWAASKIDSNASDDWWFMEVMRWSYSIRIPTENAKAKWLYYMPTKPHTVIVQISEYREFFIILLPLLINHSHRTPFNSIYSRLCRHAAHARVPQSPQKYMKRRKKKLQPSHRPELSTRRQPGWLQKSFSRRSSWICPTCWCSGAGRSAAIRFARSTRCCSSHVGHSQVLQGRAHM